MCKDIKKPKINYEKLADRMYDLYVTVYNPFIVQRSNGSYERMDGTEWGNLKDNKNILIRHLQSKQTVGVFCHSHTKFMCIDIDFGEDLNQAKWVTYKIINIFRQYGIEDKYINASFSGKKGYHALIFFDNVVSYKQIHFLYDLIIEELYYSIDYEALKVLEMSWKYSLIELKQKIELRPKDNFGLKLELSIHQETKKKCYFCDINNNLEPIKSIEYLYKINQLPREILDIVFEKAKQSRRERQNIDYFNDEIKNKSKPANSQNLYIDEEYTIEYIENLIENGLTILGSRHHSLMKIARYYNHLGHSKEENEKLLIEWMSKQSRDFYKATESEYLRDIKNIIKFVYENNRGIKGEVRDISINRDEMMEIIKHKEKPKKLLFYALIIHAKRYAINNGEFYMTYKQIAESVKISNDSISKYLLELVNDSEIIITRKNQHCSKYMSLPNKYIISNRIISTNNKSNKEYIIKNDIVNLNDEYNNCIVSLFNKKEIKNILPDYQYREVNKLYKNKKII